MRHVLYPAYLNLDIWFSIGFIALICISEILHTCYLSRLLRVFYQPLYFLSKEQAVLASYLLLQTLQTRGKKRSLPVMWESTPWTLPHGFPAKWKTWHLCDQEWAPVYFDSTYMNPLSDRMFTDIYSQSLCNLSFWCLNGCFTEQKLLIMKLSLLAFSFCALSKNFISNCLSKVIS